VSNSVLKYSPTKILKIRTRKNKCRINSFSRWSLLAVLMTVMAGLLCVLIVFSRFLHHAEAGDWDSALPAWFHSSIFPLWKERKDCNLVRRLFWTHVHMNFFHYFDVQNSPLHLCRPLSYTLCIYEDWGAKLSWPILETYIFLSSGYTIIICRLAYMWLTATGCQ
jgi:hypothetical protein